MATTVRCETCGNVGELFVSDDAQQDYLDGSKANGFSPFDYDDRYEDEDGAIECRAWICDSGAADYDGNKTGGYQCCSYDVTVVSV